MDTPLVCFLGFIVVAFILISINLKYKLVMSEHDLKFERDLNKLNTRRINTMLESQLHYEQLLQKNNYNKITVDTKTYSLVMLAVNNSNDNEARAAAVIACKKLIKLISKA